MIALLTIGSSYHKINLQNEHIAFDQEEVIELDSSLTMGPCGPWRLNKLRLLSAA